MLKNKFRFRYIIIISLICALAVAVIGEGIISAERVVNLPDDSVRLLSDGSYAISAEGYGVEGENYYASSIDPQLIFDDINTEVNYIYIDFASIVLPRMAIQAFTTNENLHFTAENSSAVFTTSYTSDYVILKVDAGQCEDLRLDLDGNFTLDDIVVSASQITMQTKLFSNFSFLAAFVLFAGIAFALICFMYFMFYSNSKHSLQMTEKLFVLGCLVFYSMWIFTSPYYCPDETMRFDVSEFLFENGRLPVGREAAHPVWGFSYALLPTMLCNLLDYIPMKLMSLFSTNGFALLLSARMISVVSAAATVYFMLKASKLIFKKPFYMIPVCVVAAIPQFAFLSGYVNNDMLALLGISIILYTWTLVLKEDWSFMSCFMLCVGMSICALSYYNSYTWVLMSMLFYLVSYFSKHKKDFKGFTKYTAFIVIVTLAMISYIFLRHLVLYKDLLGFNISHEYGETYGQGNYKPSLRATPQNKGYSIWYMLFDMHWLKISFQSFVGVFGGMSVFLRGSVYRFYALLFAVAFLGAFIGSLAFIAKKKKITLLKAVYVFCILACMTGALGLSIYYSYFDDFQPQGRYCYPGLPALAMLVGFGIYSLCSRLKKEHQYAIVAGLCAVLFAIDIDALLTVLY